MPSIKTMQSIRTKQSSLTIAIAMLLSPVFVAPMVQAADQALEEVIVTARKREENLQQVPVAINVFTADALKDRQIDNLVDMQSSTPNVTMSETSGLQAGSLSVFIRGIGNDPGFEQGIGVYLDDVYLQRQTGLMMDVFDVDRIEILKGPQGNLYGRNTIGGAIKYITKEPDDTVQAHLEGKIGSYDLRQVKGSASGPLVDGLLYGGVGLAYKKRDGIQTNLYDGRKYNAPDARAVRGELKLTPLDTLTMKLMGNFTSENGRPALPTRLAVDETASMLQYRRAIAVGALPANAPLPDLTENQSPDKVNTAYDFDDFHIITRTLAATIQWEIDDNLAFKSVTAQRSQSNVAIYDFDTSDQVGLQTTNRPDSHDFSQELQLNYSGDGIDAVGGVYYGDARVDTPSRVYLGPRFPIPGQLPLAYDRYTDTTKDFARVRTIAYYGNVDYDLTDDWHASAGLRFTKDMRTIKRDATFSGLVYTPFGVAGPDQPLNMGGRSVVLLPSDTSFPETSASWTNYSPTFKLSYDIDEDTMAYASVASGFKSGNFNTTSTVLGEVAPEKVRTYSTGLKTTLADGRLRFNTEVFYNDYTDKQLSTIKFVGTQLSNSIDNVGKAHTSGVDFEANWLTPIDGLQIDLSVGYLDSVMDEYTNDSDPDGDAADHTSLGFAPRWTVGSRASYTVPVNEWGDLIVAGDVAYRAKAYTNSPVDRNNELAMTQQAPEYALYNASVVFKTQDGHWRFGLDGKNLGDKRVIVNTYSVSPFIDAGYNDPRTWSVSVGYDY
jgi:iron complex outermembrane receptor protein